MNYKDCDSNYIKQFTPSLISTDPFDYFPMLESTLIANHDYSLSNFKKLCDEFEGIMASYTVQANDDGYFVSKLGIDSDQYYRELHALLIELYNYLRHLGKEAERKIREYAIIEKLSSFIAFEIEMEEDEEEEIPQDDQNALCYALCIIYKCAKLSKNLCREIVLYGILMRFKCDFKKYNDRNRFISLLIFFEVFDQKIEEARGFIEYVLDLSNKYITQEENDETYLFWKILFSMNEYRILSVEHEKKYRRAISKIAFFILDNEDRFKMCISLAIKGLSDLARYDWYILEHTDLIDIAFNYFNKTVDVCRMPYIISLLIRLYEQIPETRVSHYKELAEKAVPKIIDSLNFDDQNNLHVLSMDLCKTILQQFRDLFYFFTDEIFLGKLFDSLYMKQVDKQIKGLRFASFLLQMANQKFINTFFSCQIYRYYLDNLVIFERDDNDFAEILKGIISSLDMNFDLVKDKLNEYGVVEYLENVDTNEKGSECLEIFFKKLNRQT